MTRELSIGFSPCPNDTFIFYALTHGKVKIPGVRFRAIIRDVEELNQLALKGEVDITKISYHTLGHVLQEYCLLRSGGALGRGCGPLLVTKSEKTIDDLKNKPIAVPGRYTTAFLLLWLYNRELAANAVFMPFDRIMPAIVNDEVVSGLIIHEGRFTYRKYHLSMITDLGRWWEEQTGLPIPLGGIVGKRTLGDTLLKEIDKLIAKSINYACTHLEEALPYINSLAQELDQSIQKQHIGLYVNDFSKDIGHEGEKAVRELLKRAMQSNLIPENNNKIICYE